MTKPNIRQCACIKNRTFGQNHNPLGRKLPLARKPQTRDFLAKQEIMRLSHHGFVRRKNTLTNLLEYLLDVVYLDFSNAFDKVPIRRLLH